MFRRFIASRSLRHALGPCASVLSLQICCTLTAVSVSLLVVVGQASVPFALGQTAREEAKQILARALAAQGGSLGDRDRASTWNEAGEYLLMGQAVKFKARWYFASRGLWRMDFEAVDSPLRVKVVVNGERGWQLVGGKMEELHGERWTATRQQGYLMEVLSLYPLLEKSNARLTLLAEKEIAGKACVGVRVAHNEFEDVLLWCDKTSQLLTACETTVLNDLAAWEKVKEERHFLEWKQEGERRMCTRLKVFRDGQLLLDVTRSEHHRHEQLPANLFAEPAP